MPETHRLRIDGGGLREVLIKEVAGITLASTDRDVTWKQVSLESLTDTGIYKVRIDEGTHIVQAKITLGETTVTFKHGDEYIVGTRKRKKENNYLIREGENGEWDIVSPITGQMKEIHVHNGQEVQEDTPAIDIEAMKMVSTLRAGRPGIVKDILVQVGDNITQGQSLISFSPPSTSQP